MAGLTLIDDFLLRLRNDLQDLGGSPHWPDVDLLRYINDGCAAIVALRPQANPVSTVAVLVPGCRQEVPPGIQQVVDFARNLGPDQNTPGRVPRRVSTAQLLIYSPDWQLDNPNPVVHLLAHEPDKEPGIFWVYPPQPATGCGSVQVIGSRAPDLVAAGGSLPISDLYVEALVMYVLSRCYAKDTEGTINPGLAGTYRQAYYLELGAESGTAGDAKKKGATA